MNLIDPMDIVRKSIALYKEHRDLFASYIKLLAIPSGAVVIGSEILNLFFAELPPVLGFAFLFLLVIPASVVSVWISIAMIRAIGDLFLGVPVKPVRDMLKASVPLIIQSVIVSILSALAVLGGLLLFIIPGIIFSIWFAFAVYALVLDGKRNVSALVASKALVKGRWFAVATRLGIPAILFAAAAIIAQNIIAIPAEALLKGMQKGTLPAVFISIVVGLFGTAISVFLAPLFSAAPTILYLELKKTPVQRNDATPPEPPKTV